MSPIDDSSHPFDLGQAAGFSAFRAALAAVGYTEEALDAALRIRRSGDPVDIPEILYRTVEPTPLNSLVRLFALGQPIPVAAARAAVAHADLQALLAVGLLHRSGDSVRSEAKIQPVGDLLVASDFGTELKGKPLPPNHVLSVGIGSLMVAGLTVRRQGERALDLGCGSGVQGLLAARHAERVICTDINCRALNFARLNARLNGIDNLELREGSLFDPIAHESFDLIAANPPFVISPETTYEYRDGGLPGDTISERVIRESAARLREGGFATVLFNWHHSRDSDWADRPRRWVADSGCDAWLICTETADALEYAGEWLRASEGRDSPLYPKKLEHWLRYYAEMGIGWVSLGVMILRRRAGRNWARSDQYFHDRWPGNCGEHVSRVFDGETTLQRMDDAALLDWPLRLLPEHKLEQALHAEAGTWKLDHSDLKLTSGLEFGGRIDPSASFLLVRCDGRRSLRDIGGELAQRMNRPFEQIAPQVVTLARHMIRFGFLVPVGEDA